MHYKSSQGRTYASATRRSRAAWSALVGGVSLLGLGGAAFAQTAAPAIRAEADPSRLDDVIVTAQRRAQRISDVGASIQAFDGEALDRAGITDVSRLELLTPGLTFGIYGNDAKIALRGANSNKTDSDSTSVVGLFVDGIYRPRASQQTRQFYDIERVEVLKGPQGTLYGRNTLAGAINLLTANPSLAETSGENEVTYSRFNALRVESHLNLPVSDQFGLRIASLINRSDGHIENEAGQNLGRRDDQAVRLTALWEPAPELTVIAKGSIYRDRGTSPGTFASTGQCRSVNAAGLTDPIGGLLDCRNPRLGTLGTLPFSVNGNDDRPNRSGALFVSQDYVPNSEIDEYNATVNVAYDFGGATLTSITSFTDYRALLRNDADFSSANYLQQDVLEATKSFTQELQLASDNSGAFSWTTGLYYSHDENEFFFRFNAVQQAAAAPASGPLVPTPIVSTGIVYNRPFGEQQLLDVDTYGAYAQVEYALTDRFRLIAGGRYSTEDKTLTSSSNFSANRAVTFTPPSPSVANVRPVSTPEFNFTVNSSIAPAVNVSEDFGTFTYRLGAEFDVNDDVLFYANYATGYLSGLIAPNGAITTEQKSDAIEAGVKATLFDGRVQLNLSGYINNYVDLATSRQIPSPADPNTVLTIATNGGDIEAKGIDFEVIGQVTDEFSFNFGLSLLDAQFGQFGVSPPYQQYGGVALRGNFLNLSGTTPPWSPNVTFNIGAQYLLDLGPYGTLVPSAQIYYSDDYSANGANIAADPQSRQDSYTKTDLRLAWTPQNERLRVEIFVENLENEIVLARNTPGGRQILQASYLYPRNYGVKVGFKF